MKKYNFMPEGWNTDLETIQIDDLNNVIENKVTLQGIVEKCDENYNLYVKFGNGLNGVIPRNEIEDINVDETGLPKDSICRGKINKFVQFKVKEINNDNVPILSRKQVQEETLNIMKNTLMPGEKVPGIVKSITNYGAFVEIGGGVVGLAHIEDLSVARIKSPSERLKVGQKVEIVVKCISKEKPKIDLSYKENYGTWEQNADKFKEGMKTKGIVRETEKNKNGIFIELLPNLVGMAEYKEGLQYGSKIDVKIKKIDYDKKKVKLLYC